MNLKEMAKNLPILLERLQAIADRLPNAAKDAEERTEREQWLLAENTTLRAIVAKHMPCHYCHVTDMAQCPHGFPGCALADDLNCYGSDLAEELRKTRQQLADLRQLVALRMKLLISIADEIEAASSRINFPLVRASDLPLQAWAGALRTLLILANDSDTELTQSKETV